MKLLFVSSRNISANKNGAYRVASRNLKNISEILDKENVITYSVDKKSRLKFLLNLFLFKRIEDISLNDEKNILKLVHQEKIEVIFLDTSNYGYLSKKLKKENPNLKIIIFCHDITFQLFNSILDLKGNGILNKIRAIKNRILLKIVYKNESYSFKNSDKILTLTKRDKNLLKEIYGYETNEIIPVTFDNKKSEKKIELEKNKEKFIILFVGIANFSPNIEAINFFIRDVLPYIDAKFLIIGKDMEIHKEKYEKINKKVLVVGTVESVEQYYRKADCVVAPIFSGGGMKVKTAEALMYGKTIFGTKEAFEGYELDYEKVGGICNTADEFIYKINEYKKKFNGLKENSYSKIVFNNKYSYEASKKLFKKVLKELEC